MRRADSPLLAVSLLSAPLAAASIAAALVLGGCSTTPEREAERALASMFNGRYVQEVVNDFGEPEERIDDGHGGEVLAWSSVREKEVPEYDPEPARDFGRVTIWAGPDGRIYKWQSVTRGASGTTRLGTRSK